VGAISDLILEIRDSSLNNKLPVIGRHGARIEPCAHKSDKVGLHFVLIHVGNFLDEGSSDIVDTNLLIFAISACDLAVS